jgi:hypothetical protein
MAPPFFQCAFDYVASRVVGALATIGNAIFNVVRSAGVRSAMLDSFTRDFGAAAGAVDEAGMPLGLAEASTVEIAGFSLSAPVIAGATAVVFAAVVIGGAYLGFRSHNPDAATTAGAGAEDYLQAIQKSGTTSRSADSPVVPSTPMPGDERYEVHSSQQATKSPAGGESCELAREGIAHYSKLIKGGEDYLAALKQWKLEPQAEAEVQWIESCKKELAHWTSVLASCHQ